MLFGLTGLSSKVGKRETAGRTNGKHSFQKEQNARSKPSNFSHENNKNEKTVDLSKYVVQIVEFIKR